MILMILMILVFGLIQRKMHEYAYGEGGRSRIQIHDIDVAVVVHYAGGKNIFTFDPAFIAMPVDIRPVFTLRQLSDAEYLTHALIRTQKLAPVLSNLLPEGILREQMAEMLQCHPDNEFSILQVPMCLKSG